MEIDLSTDAPPSPERTLRLAETMAEAVRVLNHQTRHREALRYPSDADRLIRDLATAAARLPQLLGQVAEWLAVEQAAARIVMEGGSRGRSPEVMTDMTRMRLEQAAARARELGKALDGAASVTCDMGARDA